MAGATVSVSTGAMSTLLPKLSLLIQGEYKHLKGVKGGISFLKDELSSMHTLLVKLANNEEKLDDQVKDWRNKVRELSYDIEDCIDLFMHKVSSSNAKASLVQKTAAKIRKLWSRHKIANLIEELKARVIEESDRRLRYNFDEVADKFGHVQIDPRLPALYVEAEKLVGIDGPREKIIKWLEKDESRKLKIVSIVGFGGLGKTTLANQVYHKIKGQFDCSSFVPISRNPNTTKILADMLKELGSDVDTSDDQRQLISKLRTFLKHKRYLIIVDDIWSTQAWELVKCALPENNLCSRIILTTRNTDVASSCCSSLAGYIHNIQPLNEQDSQKLFFKRIFGDKSACPPYLEQVSHGIISKCHGLPLAIISIASLLAGKSRLKEQWEQVYNSIGCLKNLVRLLVNEFVKLPNEVGDLQALQQLSFAGNYNSIVFVEQLKRLANLREIGILLHGSAQLGDRDMARFMEALKSSLAVMGKQGLQSLQISYGHDMVIGEKLMDLLCYSPCLRKLVIDSSRISRLSKQMALLVNLRHLDIGVSNIKQGNLCVLGSIPTLLFVRLFVKNGPDERLAISSHQFQCLKQFIFISYGGGLEMLFLQEAMPELRRLSLSFSAEETDCKMGFEFSFKHLASLEHLNVRINCNDATRSRVETAEASVRNAASAHPGCPRIEIIRKYENCMRDDKVDKEILKDIDGHEVISNVGSLTVNERILLALHFTQRVEVHGKYLIIVDDIWSTKAWEFVKSALPDNNLCSRIITTTRDTNVATSCCYTVAGHIHNIQPLSEQDSRELFLKRVFRDVSACPPYLEEVSCGIIRKCHGLPLAIISVASLLVGKPNIVEQWEEVYNSIGSAFTQQGMTDILLLSYYDLPHYLKTCLLYLSMFPEDYMIEREVLIWRWIAEGFISKVKGLRLDQVAENYFNDLVNRSMIQPIDIQYDGRANVGPDLQTLHCLRVLVFENCHGIGTQHIKHLESFFRLAYLSISSDGITELPEQIGDLKYLQTLDIRRSGIKKLPPTIGRLQNLARLLVGNDVELPNEIGDLQALQELSDAGKYDSIKFVQELRRLTRLSVLRIMLHDSNKLGDHNTENYEESLNIKQEELLIKLNSQHAPEERLIISSQQIRCLKGFEFGSYYHGGGLEML
uniref:Uncharacterized protein n=1 Tax=Oryza rufipogon TaxID=4529 RepID=A0A0E0RFT9_ORYRU